MQKTCVFCEEDFTTSHRAQRYCSKSCAKRGATGFQIASVAALGGHGNKGKKHSVEHVAKRSASLARTLAGQKRSCVKCGEEYTPARAAQKYCSGRCYEAVRKSNPKVAARIRDRAVQRARLTAEEYDALFEFQGGRCAICKEETPGKRLCVDHCHSTQMVRGLLCHPCNQALGLYRDNPQILTSAIAYLVDAESRKALAIAPTA